MGKSLKSKEIAIREEIKRQRKPRKFNVEDLLISPKMETIVINGVQVQYKTEIDNEDYFEVQQALLGEEKGKVRYRGADTAMFLFAWRMLHAATPTVTLEKFLKMDPNWTGKFSDTVTPRLERSLSFLEARKPTKK